ncbi:hypothetical protein K501DRAFT_330502 [Backusella circina FSU 941]|nr:hypothetical protein K501DRAFT_330502 [Backusella circina FSU 941]
MISNNVQSTLDSFGMEKTAMSPMFELSGIHGRITLDNVYLNGLHALKRLDIRNLSDQSILVKMRSNLRNQIAFQLDNENISNLPDANMYKASTTNTVAWSCERLSQEYPFNQLFNYVNYIDEIKLEPGQSRSFILAFLPETFCPDDTDTKDDDDDDGFDVSLANEVESFSIFNVTGSLFFFGYYEKRNFDLDASLDESKDVLSTSSLADYQVSVKFRASVCQSMLWTDVAETGLNFDDCVLGETYYKDFTIQNRSEIELYWLLNTVDLSNLDKVDWIQFIDIESGSDLEKGPIEFYGTRHIRIIFTPKEVGEFNYDLQLENVNDPRNVIQTKIHATVRSVLRKETLIVSSGNILDFGDCISGSWAVQQIVLNNVSESPVEVRFLPEGADVIFDIKQDHPVLVEKEDGYSETRSHPTRRKYSREGNNRTGFNTPTTTLTSISELSNPNSEMSSRSTSPTPSRGTTEITEDSDSEIGLGLSHTLDSATSSIYMEPSSMTESSDTTPLTTLSTAESFTRIEDLVIKPGTERVIQVSYRPQKDASINDFNAGQLIRRNFRISLEYGSFRTEEPKERKVIQCRARTCTSFVEAIPKLINFGDTDVGTLKSLPIHIFNRSDIVARVELQFSSKVLNCLRGEITIQPKGYVELKLDLYPRKVNPDYRKQITLVNFLNKDNDQIIEVHSTNIDKNRVTFHSLFYRILTATGANFVDFGSIALNSSSLRTFTVENISDKPLSLEITTSLPDDIAIYTRNKTKVEKTKKAKKESADTNVTPSLMIDPINTGDKSVADTSNRRRSTLLLETMSNRRINKPSISHDNLKPISEAEATQNRRTSDAKKDLIAARQFRSMMQQIKMDQAHSSTAYLDLALPPLQSLRSYRRKLIQVNRIEASQLQIQGKSRLTCIDEVPSSTDTLGKKSKASSSESTKKSETGLLQETKPKSLLSAKTSTKHKHASKRSGINGINSHSRLNVGYGSKSSNMKYKRSMGITAARYKSRKNLDWSDIAGKSRVPFEDLMSVLEHGSKATPPLFPKQSSEEKFVRYQIAWRRELDRLIEKGVLVRSSMINVDPKGEEEVVIVITPKGTDKPHIQSAPKKQDARVFLKLVEFDRDIEQTEFENLLDLTHSDIPVREIMLRSQLCRSVMDLGQKNINFGLVERNERHAKTIILHNRSETPLLYTIRKSGSIASGDIDLDVGRYGVVRAYGKREVDFVFEPTLSGPFIEKLIVENIRDRTNDQVLLLKAQVRKPSSFVIKSSDLSFGYCLVDQLCPRTESVTLTNTNKQSRLFEVRVDPNEVLFGPYYGEFKFDVKEDGTNTLSKEAEEEIENLEQKLKIARRKAQPDKITKYLRKLTKLKNPDESEKDGPSNKEGNVVFKKTAESVVFPLDPNATKTISVSFKPVPRPFHDDKSLLSGMAIPSSETKGCLSVKGRILIHEYKNTDVCKSVVYTADVYSDEASYINALATLDDVDTSIETPANDTSTEPLSKEEEELPPLVEPLQLERSFFDGGRIEINQKSEFYLRITNQSSDPLDFDFIENEQDSVLSFSSENQPLQPEETRKVMYVILPNQLGKHEHTFLVRNKRSGSLQPFTIQLLVHLNQYLDFPSLADEVHGVLDLGFSYVDPGSKYSQVTPLLVENTSGQDILITCQSNLSHQVLIFMDEAGERGLVEMMPLKRGGMTTVWVAVQPNLLTGYLGNSANECRELVGGIRFSVYENQEEEQILMLTQTVKFTSIIGQSHLEVSHSVINLGYTELLHKEFYGAFTIKNKSGQLPLDYEVECANGNIVLDRRGGTLQGWSNVKLSRHLVEYNDGSRRNSYDDQVSNSTTALAHITFRLSSYKYGLLNEKIIVTNKRNSKEVFTIDTRLFVDCKKLDAWAIPSKKILCSSTPTSASDDDSSEHREALPLPLIKWESIYICPIPQETENMSPTDLQVMMLPEKDENRLYVREIDVSNTSGQPMQLVVMSDIDINAEWVADEDKIKVPEVEDHDLFSARSGQVALQPGQRIRVRIHSPSPDKLDEMGRTLALQGESGSLKGVLSMYDVRQNIQVLAIELEALFCMSRTEISVDHINLGKVGHVTSWKPARFEFQIHNLADVPASYDIVAPPYLQFTPLDKNGLALKQKTFYIPSRKTQNVQGFLLPKEMPDQSSGWHRFNIVIKNLRNQSNSMEFPVKALMTVFELGFERLIGGELVLPVLHHPIALQNATCDNWFEVLNKTDDDIRIEIGAVISPEIEGYVNFDVLSRYTNSPLKGDIALGPQGSIEVRIRASPNEMSRLPHNRPDLTDSAGFILANIWVTTRLVDENDYNRDEQTDENRVKEMIPVRCVLEEVPAFSLSERRLDFKLVTHYQDADNEYSSPEATCIPHNRPLTIINHASKVPLRFKVTVEGPAEFPAHEIVQISELTPDNTGMIEPGSTVSLSVTISNPSVNMPGQFKIHVDDLDGLAQSRQTALMYVTEIVWDL